MNYLWKGYLLLLILSVVGFAYCEEEKKENAVKDKPETKRDNFITPFFEDSIIQMGFLQSPWGHLSRLDRDLFDLGRQLSAWDRDFRGLANLFNCPGLVDRVDFFPSVESHVDEKSGKYIVNLPLGKDLAPEDVKVSMKDHIMTIEAKKEHKAEDGKSRSYQEFMRKFTLPDKVNATEVKSLLTPEGYLKIEAPLSTQALPEQEKPKEIPVNHA